MSVTPNKHEKISGWWAVREIDHLFSAFARYTKFVIYSKWGLLAVAGLLIITLIIWPLVTKDKSGLRVSFVDNNTVKAPPTSPVMNKPEYRGTGDAGQEYIVTGTKATQATPGLILLDDVNAHMEKPGGTHYTLTAKRAEYRQNEKRIELFEDVTVIDQKATTFKTQKATVNTATMDVTGRDPVDGVGTMGTIRASGFDISNNGAHIVFYGGREQLVVTIERKKR